MRKIIRTGDLTWESEELIRNLLNIKKIPSLIIIETVEEE